MDALVPEHVMEVFQALVVGTCEIVEPVINMGGHPELISGGGESLEAGPESRLIHGSGRGDDDNYS